MCTGRHTYTHFLVPCHIYMHTHTYCHFLDKNKLILSFLFIAKMYIESHKPQTRKETTYYHNFYTAILLLLSFLSLPMYIYISHNCNHSACIILWFSSVFYIVHFQYCYIVFRTTSLTGCKIFFGMSAPQFITLFFYYWALRWFPVFHHCIQYCDEHMLMTVFFCFCFLVCFLGLESHKPTSGITRSKFMHF